MFVETVQVASLETYIPLYTWSWLISGSLSTLWRSTYYVRAHYNELRGAYSYYSWTFTTARCMGQVAGPVKALGMPSEYRQP